jgi:hypothetical protein
MLTLCIAAAVRRTKNTPVCGSGRWSIASERQNTGMGWSLARVKSARV